MLVGLVKIYYVLIFNSISAENMIVKTESPNRDNASYKIRKEDQGENESMQWKNTKPIK